MIDGDGAEFLEESPEERDFFEADKAAEAETEAPVEAEPEEETGSEPPEPVEKEEKEPHQVPLAALKEERLERQRYQREATAAAERAAKMEAAFQKVMERLNKSEEPQIPAYEEDPAAHLKATTDMTAKEIAELKQALQQNQQYTQQTQAQEQMTRTYVAQAQAFAKENPDFGEAYQFLMAERLEEIQNDLNISPEEAQQVLMNYEQTIVQKAFRDGANPAERLYKNAKRRGFKSQTGDAKLETLEKGAKAARTLSATSGPTAKNAPTLAEIADLDGEDFDKAFERHFGLDKRKGASLFG